MQYTGTFHTRNKIIFQMNNMVKENHLKTILIEIVKIKKNPTNEKKSNMGKIIF
jgi:hypothetical protein